MSGGTDDQEPVDLAPLTTDQLAGLACINCNRSGGTMRAIATAGNTWSPQVVAHVDPAVCVRHVARYVVGLHLRVLSVFEDATATLGGTSDIGGEPLGGLDHHDG